MTHSSSILTRTTNVANTRPEIVPVCDRERIQP